MVMDSLLRRATNGQVTFDDGGIRARHGRPLLPFVEAELAQPYYAAPPPKSTGREDYGEAFLQRLEATGATHPVILGKLTR